MVNYVYHTYKKELEKLASMNFRAIKRDLNKIRPNITPWENEPTAIDYVIRYERIKTREEADEHMKQVKARIIDYNPFANIEDW
ncbi:hypothetical protein ACFVSS_08875 [Peribacillus butanolivorans]|uniref:hypothetical protein n=1 Tax=Peribacillus butanolivorans TaxID=421767 RepID=UPI0036DA5644